MRDVGPGHPGKLERRLAGLLSYGTLVATVLIAAGLAFPVPGPSHDLARTTLSTIGVAIIIVLPVLRVTVMAFAFVVERDLLFAAIASTVFAIIMLSLFLGDVAT